MSGPNPEKAMLGLPDRWKFCPKAGKVVKDLFFPFKTPLCDLYDNQIPELKYRFHPHHVFKHPNINGKKLGLWVDLTKTDRYYSSKEVNKHGCEYRKMKLAGHGSTPTEEEVNQFIRLVKGFQRDHPGELVGVHCTHGFNRTGFLIVAYLVTVEDCAVDAAIFHFARDRPCGIYKQDYIDDLIKRYGDPDDDITAPQRPSWEYGEDLSINDSSAEPGTSGNSSPQRQHDESSRDSSDMGSDSRAQKKQFMDGQVPGVTIVQDRSKKTMLRSRIAQLLNFKKKEFPGLQPVSLDWNNIGMMYEHRYQVSWKADGMRYMVYIHEDDQVFAFDRDNEVFEIPKLYFPHYVESNRHVKDVLVDTEIIIEHIKENGKSYNRTRMLIYDLMHFEGKSYCNSPFDVRTEAIKRKIVDPRVNAMRQKQIDGMSQSMSVRRKDFWPIECVPKLFSDKFLKNLGHEIDGLIFQPISVPYTPGRNDMVLKWKPPSHNSIDFKLNIRKVQKDGMLPEFVGCLYVLGLSEPFATMKATRTLQQYDGKIIECKLLRNSQWEFMRERTDKSHANGFKTAQAVLNSMLHPIEQNALCEWVMKWGRKFDDPPRKPNPQQQRPQPQNGEQRSAGRPANHNGDSSPPEKRMRVDEVL